MAGLVEQSPIQRESNANWVNNVIIPKLYKKQFPLPRVIQVLYRANTTGIKDQDFKQNYDLLISEERRKKAQIEEVTVSTPQRGDINRALKIVGDENVLLAISPEKLRELKAVKMFITQHIEDHKKWIYIPPAQRVDDLAYTLSHSTEALLKQADNFQQALPVISDFVLLFDALHPYVDGTGRAMRAASNYMAYPFGYQFKYPLSEGHIDIQSKTTKLMLSFEYNVQIEEGYRPDIYPEGYPLDEYKRKQIDLSINYKKLSDSFERIMLQRRENKRLLPFYQQMDSALAEIAVPRNR